MFSGGVADSTTRPFGNQFAWGLLFAGRQLIGSPEHIIVNIKCGSHASDHRALNASRQGSDHGQGEEAPVRRLGQDVATESPYANAARLWLTPCSQRTAATRGFRRQAVHAAPRRDETGGRSSAPSRPTSRATAAAAESATTPQESDPACPAAFAGPSSPPTRFRRLGNPTPNRVQINVHAARQHGRFIQQPLALEPLLQKTAGAAVLAVRAWVGGTIGGRLQSSAPE